MRTLSALCAFGALPLLLAGCPKPAPTPDAAPEEAAASASTSADGKVCCESFGYGAMMAKCCESYAWVEPSACTVPEGFVGGGKAVVDGSLCPKP